jgi:CheY-like chemotaxis protein
MRVVCAWCERDGGSGFLREQPPLEDATTTHGICDRHEADLRASVRKSPGQRRSAGDGGWESFTAEGQIVQLLRVRPEIGFCTPCLAGEVRLPVQTVALLTARLTRSGRCEQGEWWCAVCLKKTVVTLGSVPLAAQATVEHAPRVLIVDDDPDTVHILTSYFAHIGYRTQSAMHGGDALMAITHDRPDLVLLDIWMPGLDGLTVLKRARAVDASLPIIMLTANTDAEAMRKARGLGAFDYMVKPINLDTLAVRASAALHGSRVA